MSQDPVVPSRFTPPAAAPLRLGAIMRIALEMYRAAPGAVLGIALISTVPNLVLSVGGQLAYGTHSGTRAVMQGLLSLLPQLLLGPLSIAATAVIAMQLFAGMPAHAGSALERVGLRFWPLAAVVVVSSVGIVIGGLALLIPGIYLAVVWLFAPIVAVVESLGLRSALARSAALAKGAFWWLLAGYLAIQITVALGALVLTDLVDLTLTSINGDSGIVLRGLATCLALTVVTPVASLGLSLMYLSRRVSERGSWPAP